MAERIARLQRAMEMDQEHLEVLQAKLGEKETEFNSASEAFKQANTQWEDARKRLDATGGRDAAALEEAERTIADREKKRKLARERFDLAIDARKTAQEQITQLEAKIASDQQTLEKLVNPASLPVATSAPDALPSAEKPPAKEAAAVTAPDVAAPGLPPVSAVSGLAAPATGQSTPRAAPVREAARPAPTKEVLAAQQQAAEATAAANHAEQEAEEVGQRLQTLDKNIALEQQAREAARKRGDNAEAMLQTLEEELQKAFDRDEPLTVTREIRKASYEAQQRLREARVEVRQRAAQLDRLQAERVALLSEQLAAARQVDQKQRQADEARQNLEAIENPFTRTNIINWLLEKGPKLVIIAVVALGFHLLIKLLALRIVAFLTRHESDGRRKKRENRANTLVGVFHNTGVIAIYVGAVLMALDVTGIPVAPLLGGAAVIGLAVAFAAQNLIKDYFYGFMILMEDQYGVNDVVTIGGVTGLVERITLRITVIRDLDAVHFVPHGQISTVSNLTHKWSRAVFNISVSYKEDVDRVMDVLVDLGRRMRLDPEFGKFILEDPEMLGVDSLGESAVVIKFFLKTKPLKQWAVKREMHRRIKKTFDGLGIEIPFPHRTVYHRTEQGMPLNVAEPTSSQHVREAA
ncbi:MAG: mechanosensitive ion channel [Thermoguttaceae bacterium]|nr:mechanosensitive ion channel [Thermoguttaceae bacterium]